jgi:predicted alpha/beta-fold hydrolase
MRRLLQIYSAVADRHQRSGSTPDAAMARRLPISVEEARRIRSQREFDHRIVAARHGFTGADAYYEQASVGPLLGRLRVPTLLVAATGDPIVPAPSLEPFLESAPERLEVRWVRGGHVAFPRRLSLGEPGPVGLEVQVLSWCSRRGRDAGSWTAPGCYTPPAIS